jgi:hypothetical protein
MNNQDSQAKNNDRFAHLKAIAVGEIQAPSSASNIRFWTHEPYQPLIGEILGFDSFEHPRYGTQQTVIVEREDGEVVSAILTDYLQEGMERQNGNIGDLVLIEKQGKDISKNGNPFNKFRLVIDQQ